MLHKHLRVNCSWSVSALVMGSIRHSVSIHSQAELLQCRNRSTDLLHEQIHLTHRRDPKPDPFNGWMDGPDGPRCSWKPRKNGSRALRVPVRHPMGLKGDERGFEGPPWVDPRKINQGTPGLVRHLLMARTEMCHHRCGSNSCLSEGFSAESGAERWIHQ